MELNILTTFRKKTVLIYGLLLTAFVTTVYFILNQNEYRQISNLLNTADFNFIHKQFLLKEQLCVDDVKNFQNFSIQKYCPTNGIVTAPQGGRLGNQIWEYMAIFLVANIHEKKPYVPTCIKNRLSNVFENLSLPTLEEIAPCLDQIDFVNKNLPKNNQSIKLGYYAEEAKLLADWKNNNHDIKEIFKIKKTVQEESENILRSIANRVEFPIEHFIGIHVRRTDYFNHIKIIYKLKVNTTDFFINAIDYFKNKYKNSIFVVVSDDPVWCIQNLKSKGNVFVVQELFKTDSDTDLAIMSNCNDSIIDFGTYGMWGAFLAGGETIYFHFNENHVTEQLGRYLKNWHSLETNSTLKNYIKI